MSKRIDLLTGNIGVALTKLALPIMATSLIQMAYNLTDMIWIGRMGSEQVASVGAAGMYMWLSSAFAVLARMGGQVRMAQSLGAGERKRAVLYAQNALQMGLFFAVIYSLVMVVLRRPLIGFFKLNGAQVIADAETYLMIVGGGLVFTLLNQILTGLITSTGNSRTPFIATFTGLILNMVLDPLLIFGPGFFPEMGVAGAAWATVLAQAVVSAAFLLYMMRDGLVFSKIRILGKPDWKCMGEIIRIGLPAAVQSAMFTVISMTIARLIAGWGDAAVAVQKVGSQIESISWMTAEGFSVAINSFVAQNYGARNYTRTKKGCKTALVITAVWGIVSTSLLIFLAAPIFKVFIPDSEILPLGVDYLQILGVSQLFMCVEIIVTGAFSGFGKTLPPSVANIILTFARIPMAMLLSATALGLNGIWWSISISSILKGVVVIVMFVIFLKKMAPVWKKKQEADKGGENI